MEKFRKKLRELVGKIILSAILGYIVMLLWNWCIVSIFGVVQINWQQGWGLLILSNLLFKTYNYSGKGE